MVKSAERLRKNSLPLVRVICVLALTFPFLSCGRVSGGLKGTRSDSSKVSLKIDEQSVPVSLSEGSTNSLVAVLSEKRSKDTIVQLQLTSTRNDVAQDFTSYPASVTIAAGSLSTTVSVVTAGDTLYEGAEEFQLSLSSVDNGIEVKVPSTKITVADDDLPPTLSVADVSGAEGTGSGSTSLTFTITQSAVSGKDTVVNFATSDGTAAAGTDYTTGSGTATIVAGQTTASVLISVTKDASNESNETLTLTLSGGSGYDASGGDLVASGTILNDDGDPTIGIADVSIAEGTGAGTTTATFTVTSVLPSSSNIVVNYATSNGTATTAGSDYTSASGTITITAGQTAQTFTVTIGRDAVYEGNETFLVTLSAGSGYTSAGSDLTATGTITNDDSAPTLSIADVTVAEGTGGGPTSASYTVTSSAISEIDIVVNYATSNGTATTADSDYTSGGGSITIAAGATTQTITVDVIHDAKYEGSETYTVTLSGGSGYLSAGSDLTATGTITNDDTAPTISIADVSIAEGTGAGTTTATFTVTSAAVSGVNIVFDYAASNGTATTADSDYISTTGTATIAAGATTQIVVVSIGRDAKFENDETFTVTLSNVSGHTAAGSDFIATGTITNDDTQPTVQFTTASQSVSESVGTATATLQLSAVSGIDVVIPFTLTGTATGGAGNDYTITASPVTIVTGQTSINVVATILDDGAVETDETIIATLGSPTNGTASGTTVHTLTITNNDSAGFNISGITGASDSTLDADLNGGLVPKVNWGSYAPAASYDVTIYESDATTVKCSAQNTTGTDLTFSTCSGGAFVAGTNYKAKVEAKDGGGSVLSQASNSPYDFLVNRAPAATNDIYFVMMNNNLTTVDPRGNDSDADSHSLSITAVTNGTHGTVTFTASSVTYTSDASSFTGADTFTYTISDGHGATSVGTVTVYNVTAFTWTGDTSASWAVASNWCGSVNGTNTGCTGTGAIPGASDTAIFDAVCMHTGYSCAATVDTAVSISGIKLGTGYSGTVTQSGTNGINLGTAGYVQEAGVFLGGSGNFLTGNVFTLSGGSFTSTSGTLNPEGNILTFGASATFLHNNGIVRRSSSAANLTINGNPTFYVLSYSPDTYTAARSIVLTGTMTIEGTLSVSAVFLDNASYLNGGTIDLKGNFSSSYTFGGGTSLIRVVGTGNQTITAPVAGAYYARSPSMEINKPSGTLTITGTLGFSNLLGGSSINFTYQAGTIDTTGALLRFSGPTNFNIQPGTMTFNSVDFIPDATSAARTISISGTMDIGGNVTFDKSGANNAVYNSGTISAKGNLTWTNGNSGSTSFLISGTSNQTLTYAAGTLPSGTFTVNKSSGTLLLGSNISFNSSGQDMDVQAGAVDQNYFNLTVNDQLTLATGTQIDKKCGVLTVSGASIPAGSYSSGTIIGSGPVTPNLSINDVNATEGATATFTVSLSTPSCSNVTVDYVTADGTATTANSDYTAVSTTSLTVVVGQTTGSLTVATTTDSTAEANETFNVNLSNASGATITDNSGVGTIVNNDTDSFMWEGDVDGNWNTPGNWQGGVVPGASDVAIFNNLCTGCAATIDVAGSVAGLRLDNGFTGTLTQGTGNSLTVGSTGILQGSGTFLGANADVSVSGPLNVSGGSFTSTSGTLLAQGDFTLASTITWSANSGSLHFNAPSGTISINSGAKTFQNVSLLGTAVTQLSSSLIVSGSFLAHKTGSGEVTGGYIYTTGPVTFDGNGMGPVGQGPYIWLQSTAAQTITSLSSSAFVRCFFFMQSGTYTIAGTITTHDIELFGSGAVNWGTSNVIMTDIGIASIPVVSTFGAAVPFYNLTIQGTMGFAIWGTLTVSNQLTAKLTGGTTSNSLSRFMNIQKDLILENNGFGGGTGDIRINGTGAQSVISNSATAVMSKTSINKSGGTLTLAGTMTFADTFTNTAGTVDAGTSHLIFNGTTTPRSTNYFNVTFDGGSNQTLSGTLTTTGTLTLSKSGGSITGGTLRPQGNIVVEDTVGAGSAPTSVMVIDGTTNQTLTVTSGTLPRGLVTVNKATGTLTLGTNASFSGAGQDFTLQAGVLDLNGKTLTIADTLTLQGSTTLYTGCGSYTPNTGATFVNNGATIIGGTNGSTVSIADASATEGSNVSFSPVLSVANCADVVFNYATSNGTATTADSDYTSTTGTATITAGQTTVAAPITVATGNDSKYENNETFSLTLSSLAGAVATDNVGVGTINDNDTAPTVQFVASAQAVSENIGLVTVTAEVSAISGADAVISFTLSGTATGGGGTNDYTDPTSPFTITAGSSTGSATFTVYNDTNAEANETVILTMGSPTGATASGTTIHTVTINDNDSGGPTVTGVSASTANGSYNETDVILVTVTFSENVVVNTTGGTPTLTLETGTIDQTAAYTSGSSTNILTFTYTVQAGDTSADLQYVAITSLALNGGTIRNAGDTLDADLSLPALGDVTSLGGSKNIVIDTAVPTVPTNFTDGVIYFSSTSSPTWYWTAATDALSGVASYEIAIGTSSGGTQILNWTDIGNVTTYQATGQTLSVSTTYYASIRAKDAAGNYSSVVNGDGWKSLDNTKKVDHIDPGVRADKSGNRISAVALSEDGNTLAIGSPSDDLDASGVNPVSNAGSVYVFTRSGSTWTLQQKLVGTGTNGRLASDAFGRSVAISGETLVVGADGQDYDQSGDNLRSGSGAVYVFTRSAGTWSVQQKLVSVGTNSRLGEGLGSSVDISGDTIIAGAPYDYYDAAGANMVVWAGAAHIFTRSGTTWSHQQKLVGTGTNGRKSVDLFGHSVGIDSNTVVIGAPYQDFDATGGSTANEAGAGYVFTRSGSTWSSQQKIVGTGTNGRIAGDCLGYSVSISGESIAVGAPFHGYDTAGSNYLDDSGAAFVLTRSGTTWSLQQKMVGTGTNGRTAGDIFGVTVSLDVDTLIAGASSQDFDAAGNTELSGAGAAFVFTRSLGTWSLQQKLIGTGTNGRIANDYYGAKVVVSGDVVAVGASDHSYDQNGANYSFAAGAIYTYARSATTWSLEQKIVETSDPAVRQASSGAKLGSSAAVSEDGNTLVVGVPSEPTDESGANAVYGTGATYVFVRSGANWNFQQKLVAAGVNSRLQGDGFGESVAISGDTIVVGASLHPYDETGSNSIINAGAGYVFTRSGTTWSLQQKLVGTGTNGRLFGDCFGRRVAISGDTVAIGAASQDYDATGGNMVTSAGAVYVFTRSGATWSVQQKLIATGTNARGASDSFGGFGLALSGDTIAVGVYQHDYDASGANILTDAGAVFVYSRSAGTWSLQQKLVGTGVNGRVGQDWFGFDVTLDGDNLAVGAYGQDFDSAGANSISGAGAAYVYTRSGSTWSLQQKLVASGTNGRLSGDSFGKSLSLSGDLILIGAPNHSYDSLGNNLVSGAGAAFTFTRSGGVWSEQQKLVANGTNGRVATDSFGSAVDISGTTLIIGAPEQDYDTTGDNFIEAAGAFFTFFY